MGKRNRKLISCMLSALVVTGQMQMVQAAVIPQEGTSYEQTIAQEYKIYPLPRETTYDGGGFEIGPKINLIFGTDIDSFTKEKLKAILSSFSGEITESSEEVEAALNIKVGVAGSGDLADTQLQAVSKVMTVDSEGVVEEQNIFGESDKAYDAYILKIDNNAITILGEDTDAAFYGITTLEHIIEDMKKNNTKTIQNLTMRDYASVEYRGFIEGFYGRPWSHEERMMLMQYGSKYKMNAYVFAAKDDPYHNSKWRDPYPASELAKIGELARVGNETKNTYIYALHTFMSNAFRFDTEANYQTDLKIVKDKFESLYNVGVRQFAILGDDAGGVSGDKISRLINDLDDWAKTKGDVKPFMFCPASYNAAWTSADGYKQMGVMNQQFPADAELFWTGASVIGLANQQHAQMFTQNIDRYDELDIEVRKPLMWLNWPVNDYTRISALLGPGSNSDPNGKAFLKQGEADYWSGIISNPMSHAEMNKIPLFGIADFAWNDDDYNGMQSWEDSFEFIEPAVADAYRVIATHLQDPGPNWHQSTAGESENIRGLLERFIRELKEERSILSSGRELIEEFNVILEACQVFLTQAQNTQLLEEMSGWVHSLRDIVESSRAFVETAMDLEENNLANVYANYSAGLEKLSSSENYTTIGERPSAPQSVRSGKKRIVPFATELSSVLEERVMQVINPDYKPYEPPVPFSASAFYSTETLNISSGSLAGITDQNPETQAAFSYKGGFGNPPTDGSLVYVGLDFGETREIGKIKLLPANPDGGNAFARKGVLEYSTDGVNYTPFTSELTITASMEIPCEVSARYIRLRSTQHNNGQWYQRVYTFDALPVAEKEPEGYTNAASPEAIFKKNESESGSSIGKATAVTLAPGEYTGMKLGTVREIKGIVLEGTGIEGLTLEMGSNEQEMETVDPTSITASNTQRARYIRLINNTSEEVNFTLNKMETTHSQILPPTVVKNTMGGIPQDGLVKNAFDADMRTQAIFQAFQREGTYAVIDLGQTRTINSLQMIVPDSTKDWIRHAKVEAAMTPEPAEWTYVTTIGKEGAKTSTPFISDESGWTHATSLMYSGSKPGDAPLGIKARYLKITHVGPDKNDLWSRTNEIAINSFLGKDDTYIPENIATEINANFEGSLPMLSKPLSNLIDGGVATGYKPANNDQAGYVIYNVSDNLSEYTRLNILKNGETTAQLSVRMAGSSEFVDLGTLDYTMNEFKLPSSADGVAQVRIDWQANSGIELFEIILAKKAPATVNTSSLETLIGQVEAYNTTNSVPELVAKLEDLLLKAKEAVNNPNVLQSYIDASKLALEKVFNEVKSTYPITVTTAENGEVTVSKAYAKVGDTIRVTAVPKNGYKLDKILVNGSEITGITFEMPAREVVVSAEFVKEESDSVIVNLTAQDKVAGGESFEVLVGIDEVTAPLYAGDFTLSYNKDLFTLDDIEAVAPTVLVGEKELAEGMMRILSATEGNAVERGNWLKLLFTAATPETDQVGQLEVGPSLFGGVVDGKEIIKQGEKASQSIAITGKPVIVDPDGDINGDKQVDIADLALIAYYYQAKVGDTNWDEAKKADVNTDGKVNLEDLTQVANKILKQ